MRLKRRKGGDNTLQYLLLVVLSIIVYAEVLPTISTFFELIRTAIISKITTIQQATIHIQEDIQQTQERLQPQQTHVIGFQAPIEEEGYDE